MQNVVDELSSHFSPDDDPDLWLEVLRVVKGDIARRFTEADSPRDLLLLVGACSNWLRPHQTRFRVRDEEFAWPSGYGGVGFSRTGLPELDWCCCFRRTNSGFARIGVPHKIGKRRFLVRVAIPSKTIERRRASINVSWTPGIPADVRQPLVRLLAFKKANVGWEMIGGMTRDGHDWAGELIPPPSKRL
ncbi:MAG: hypothetical protein KDB27_18980 [Planctomycetales bacterium]|nr:hypothetical protein [Planctomycetales bacterium]